MKIFQKSVFITLLFFVCIGNPNFSQTEEQKKHPRFPEVMEHYQAYQEANQKGDYNKALKEAKKALEIGLEVFGKDDNVTAIFYDNLGNLYYSKGNARTALKFFNKALEILKKSPKYKKLEEHFKAFKEAKDYKTFQREFGKVEDLEKEIFGKSHLKTAEIYNHLGITLYKQGQYNQAIQAFQYSLEIRKKYIGTEHADVATSYNNLGVVYDNKGEYDKAVIYHVKALLLIPKFRTEGLTVLKKLNNFIFKNIN